MKYVLWGLCLLLCDVSAASTQKVAVRGAIPEGLGAPLLFVEEHSKLKGIVPAYTEALIKALGKEGSLTLLTRYRLQSYLEEGKVDFLCYTSRAWAEDKDEVDWSKTLFMKKEVILGPAPMPKEVTGLDGKTIGTILNYRYPRLDALFASKHLIREDSSSEDANLNKILKGRISYVVTDEIFLDYYKTRHSSVEKNRDRLFMQEYPIACSVSRKGRVPAKDLNKAIDLIKANGVLKAIFKKYGVTLN